MEISLTKEQAETLLDLAEKEYEVQEDAYESVYGDGENYEDDSTDLEKKEAEEDLEKLEVIIEILNTALQKDEE